MNVILYRLPSCQRCAILEQKLKEKGIEYTVVTDTTVLAALGEGLQFPQLKVGNMPLMGMVMANAWINRQESRL